QEGVLSPRLRSRARRSDQGKPHIVVRSHRGFPVLAAATLRPVYFPYRALGDSMSNIEIIPLSGRPEDWDQQIERFATKTLFHESAWLDFVLTGHPSERVEYFEILEDGLPAGLFCALKARRGLFHVYGSPLPGRGMYLGPLVHTEIDQPALVTA